MNNPNSNNNDENNQLVIIEEKVLKQNSEAIIKKYMRGRFLGKGGFAKCYEATSLETKRTCAIKIIPKSILTKNRAKQKLISEIKIHKSLSHQNVVIFEHVFEDKDNVYILLELCNNNTLNELIKKRKRLTDIEVQCFINQIINGLKYLHQKKVIHRDLKLGNLFLSDRLEIKLGDFGLAAKLEFDGEKKHTICGTPNYIAPEVLEGKTGHSYEVDIWSLGVVIYTLLIGKPPYETPDIKTTYKRIKQNQYTFPDNIQISESAKHLITSILNLEPSRRPSLDEIMAHPFMKGQIPKYLPLAILQCPPSQSYIKQFTPENFQQKNIALKNMISSQGLIQSLAFGKNENSKNTLGQTFVPPKTQSSTNINSKNALFIQNNNNNNLEQQQNIRAVATTKNWFGYLSQKNNPFQMQKSQQKNFTSTLFKQFSQNQTSSEKKIFRKQSTLSTLNEQNLPAWVVQWIDYSQKYGLGYILCNGCSGVYFNDATKMIFEPSSNKVEYVERQNNSEQDVVVSFSLQEFPQDLKKKMTLLQLFRNYLKEQKNRRKLFKRNLKFTSIKQQQQQYQQYLFYQWKQQQ
ncbi:protein kinase domain protein [Ichthyophthirius multifiliis]|uniref:Serine/threonine-protein kinase PLK n=1 Tax=Ichthyophthirius multifiliis TaxID=5932 RepID=G0QSR1_ICHMU|nr:protein kinase domain protein [Ichthyophthirius multifiliis]EGR31741.1 protein kinase domain protein [Ichthyophthirius multifiliis]|eukprot:XP_004035227.1 protein kinase domain protein [Ichthyophthirius multifiliis]